MRLVVLLLCAVATVCITIIIMICMTIADRVVIAAVELVPPSTYTDDIFICVSVCLWVCMCACLHASPACLFARAGTPSYTSSGTFLNHVQFLDWHVRNTNLALFTMDIVPSAF